MTKEAKKKKIFKMTKKVGIRSEGELIKLQVDKLLGIWRHIVAWCDCAWAASPTIQVKHSMGRERGPSVVRCIIGSANGLCMRNEMCGDEKPWPSCTSRSLSQQRRGREEEKLVVMVAYWIIRTRDGKNLKNKNNKPVALVRRRTNFSGQLLEE